MSFFKNLFKTDPEVDFQMGLRAETFEGNYEKAAWFYKKAAQNGHAAGQFYFGLMLLHGRGVRQDFSEAVNFVQASANQNYYKAQYLMAQMYYKGIGVENNPTEGDKWMEKFSHHNQDSSKLSFLDL